MASKGGKSRADNEARFRRQRTLEAPKEPRRPKTHWDHVVEEMVWLSKDFESERKWKLTQAKKVALRASRGVLDQATRGEKKQKEEDQRLRKVALNISKDVKKFWTKIEKLVLYKHQLVLNEKKKKALDKQLEFLLGQTERYSTMLAENLVEPYKPVENNPSHENVIVKAKPDMKERHKTELPDVNVGSQSGTTNIDEDSGVKSEYESEDDEHTIDEDEVHIKKDERQEGFGAFKNEADLTLEELLKHHLVKQDSLTKGRICSGKGENGPDLTSDRHDYANDENYDFKSEDASEDDERTIEEDEAHITEQERQEELEALQNEVDLPIEELLKRYAVNRDSSVLIEVCPEKGEDEVKLISEGNERGATKSHDVLAVKESGNISSVRRSSESNGDLTIPESRALELKSFPLDDVEFISGNSRLEDRLYDFTDEQEDDEFVLTTAEDQDDETTLSEEEELAKADEKCPMDELTLLQKESEIPIEELLDGYKKEFIDKEVPEYEPGYASSLSEDPQDCQEQNDQELNQAGSQDGNGQLREFSQTLQPCSEEHQVEFDEKTEGRDGGDKKIADAAAAARSAQPTGFTFSTTKVRTKLPFLLKHSLREYQHIGLDWLVTMYDKRLNGILADEMGLGKTIMTIALLAHLACEKGIWGPHLIVVPTSVMLNWETEFLKWCPAFKILTYFGSAKERKLKRQGWMKPNSFHVCITTYRLVIQDSKAFKRKKWKYLILDEAHLIKNWKSQRWQTLLNFNSKRRILLTGTPLQNDLMELWSLMHFLMPHIFQSHQEFKDWFCNPITGMVEGQEKVNKEVIDRLHNVLRPFILRRLKRDVEKQLPMKHEHIISCRLSKRQRNLYEDFIASSETQATLASGNFFGMISIIMQLRKVCNHPDLFEGRPIVSSFDMAGIYWQLSSSVCSMFPDDSFSRIYHQNLGLLFSHLDFHMSSWEKEEVKAISTPSNWIKDRCDSENTEVIPVISQNGSRLHGINIFEEVRRAINEERTKEAKKRTAAIAWWNSLKCERKPIYSTSLRKLLTIEHPLDNIRHCKSDSSSYMYSSRLSGAVLSPVEHFQKMVDLIEGFTFAIPAARAPAPVCWCSKRDTSVFFHPTYERECSNLLLPLISPMRPAIVRRQVYFPDRRLIQFDCGKLQELAILLRKLKFEGHRVLIFTQMTKMLDILEAFINLYGYTYMRLDGSTQPEERQTLMQRFNTNPKIFLFILSTRSGGVGINLVGADTVIFYDSDWNPAMDQQAQDRCHRIGQTREVHIYRLISESTIEENILKKANQKRALDDLVIQSGGYNTEFFKKLDPMELFSGHKKLTIKNINEKKYSSVEHEVSLSNADVEAALKHAEDEADYMALKKVEEEEAVDNQEFTEEAVERPEDDELRNDDDIKADDPANHVGFLAFSDKEAGLVLDSSDTKEERAIVTFSCENGDADMLNDIKQMAEAAAAAGQDITSFENKLRPIDRYAVRFLELWDPIIHKVGIDTETGFEEKEWELDYLEKYKEEMEAENDDGEDPLVYEKWDADFATEAYRQQVEALAQDQLMKDLENEAKEKEAADEEDLDYIQNEVAITPKPKTKRKQKKAKYKSLKKRTLTSQSKSAKPAPKRELLLTDDDEDTDDADDTDGDEDSDSDAALSLASRQRKLKKLGFMVESQEENTLKTKSKKPKKCHPEIRYLGVKINQSHKQHDDSVESMAYGSLDAVSATKLTSRSKTVGRISIASTPIKRVVLIKPEKLKKGNLWSRDCVPLTDFWLPQEDAVLSALVHEYGPNWSLISETLYGMTAGGAYRGRYRHPAHCCERYRELVQRYILSVADNAVNEKSFNAGSGKALLKVTEDNMRTLLNVAAEQPDTEKLVQKHFACLLSSVWRTPSWMKTRQRFGSLPTLPRIQFCEKLFDSANQTPQSLMREHSQRMKDTSLNSKLLESALHDTSSNQQDDRAPGMQDDISVTEEELDITLKFEEDIDNPSIPFPCAIDVVIRGSDPSRSTNSIMKGDHLRGFQSVAENRLSAASKACFESAIGWALSTFALNDPKSRSSTKIQSLGKHKLSSPDSAKPSKSKSRRVGADHCEIQNVYSEPRYLCVPLVMPKDPNLKFDFEAAEMAERWEDGLDDQSPFCLNRRLSAGLMSTKVTNEYHWCEPELDTASLDEVLIFLETSYGVG